MRPEDFRPEDLFAQIQALVDGLAAERRAREAAEAADKAKSELIDMIGHELRTPMQGVIDMSALLLASPLDGTQLRYTETLAQLARSLEAQEWWKAMKSLTCRLRKKRRRRTLTNA